MTRQCGLWIYQIEILCLQASLLMKAPDPDAAEHSARAAVEIGAAAVCQYQWGVAKAGHLLGRALAAQDRRPEACQSLEHTLTLRRRIGDPRAQHTEALLRELAG